MTALFTARAADPDELEDIATRGRDSLRLQGFVSSREHAWAGGRILWFETPANPRSKELWQDLEGGIIACVGTLFYQGRHGAEALRSLWRDFEKPSSLALDSLFGNYLVAIAKFERVWILGDQLGMLRLYQAKGGDVITTSWLACMECTDHPRLDRVGAYDYVFSGANHGVRTPVQGIEIVDPTSAIELVSNRSQTISPPMLWRADSIAQSEDSAIDQAAEVLRDRMLTIGRGFPGCIRGALSGGFDSRLLLAAIRAVNSDMKLFVYGRPGDDDVQIARAICRALSMDLGQIDKEALTRTLPSIDRGSLAAQCSFFDGIPVDGIVDAGADRATRVEQSAGGAIVLNGGGGEIFRNFFYLREGEFSVTDIVAAFYSGFAPDAFRRVDERGEFRDYLVHGIEEQLDIHGRKLTRREVELVYPLFRVRFWTGRNNSVAARSGHFLTPLVDPVLVRITGTVPLAWKDYGRFEARLIERLSPVLAGFPLAYGFSPAQGPGTWYRSKMFLQNRRPVWLRANSARIKRALGRTPRFDLDPEIRSLFGRRLALEELINLRGLASRDQLNRVLTLEHLVRSYGVQV